MSPKKNIPDNRNRGPLYVGGGVLLVVILVVVGFWDDLGRWFEKAPSASVVEGSWVFDDIRAREQLTQVYGDDRQFLVLEKRYGTKVLTFSQGTYAMDDGDGKALPVPYLFQGYPPDACVIITGTEKARREHIFQIYADKAGKHLCMSAEGVMVPFKPRE